MNDAACGVKLICFILR